MNVTPKWKDAFEAAEHKDLEAIKYFVNQKEDVLGLTNERGQSVALIAAQQYDFPTLRYVLEKDSSVLLQSDNSSRNIMEAAIENGASYTVKYLVERHNWSVHHRNNVSTGNTPIHHACKKGQLEILKYLIEEAGGDVNVRNDLGNPPIFLAAEEQRMNVVKYLVEERRVDLTNTTNNRNENILFAATERGDLTAMRYILEEKKIPLNVDDTNDLHQTLLYVAVRNLKNGLPVVKYLVEKMRADVNIADDQSRTPLHVAAFANDYFLCRFLVEHGADIRAKDKFGYTPMENAVREELVNYFRELTHDHDRSSRSVILNVDRSLPDVLRMIVTERPSELEHLNAKQTNPRVDAVNGELNSFLAVANTIVRSVHHRASLLSPREITLGRIDPMAIDAINIVPK